MSRGSQRVQTRSSAETVPQHGLHKQHNERTPPWLFAGENMIPKSLKKNLLSELQKSNQGVREEQMREQRRENLPPFQHCEAKTRVSKGRLHVPSFFKEHLVPLLSCSTTNFYIPTALAWQRSPCCLRNNDFGLFFPTLCARLAASCKLKKPPGTKMEIPEKWPMRDFKKTIQSPGRDLPAFKRPR